MERGRGSGVFLLRGWERNWVGRMLPKEGDVEEGLGGRDPDFLFAIRL